MTSSTSVAELDPAPPAAPMPSWPPRRSVIVTGGASGIGHAVVRLLRAVGVPVGVLDRDRSALDRLEQETGRGRVLTASVSVADGRQVEEAVERFARELGAPWGLVTCAGIVRDRTLLKLTDEEWRDVLEVNLTGTFFPLRATARWMKENKGGRIVALSSIVGLRGGFGQANYAASKAGVVGLVMTAARELGRHGITVNAIAPGFVRTPMTAQYGEVLEEASKAESPLGTVSEPEDVARSILQLLAPAAAHITGTVLRVDGGQAIGA